MWYFLMIIGIFIVLVWPIINLILSFFKSKTAPIYNSKVNMLIDFATLTTKHLENNLIIHSPLIFYEQVYFFYFLQNTVDISRKTSDYNKELMLNELIKKLIITHKLDYLENKNDFKNMFLERYKAYTILLIHSQYQLSDKFFDDTIDYQIAQLDCIINHNQFTHFNPESTCTDITPENSKIKSLLTENLELIKAYLAQS